jgi:hypothetical protein
MVYSIFKGKLIKGITQLIIASIQLLSPQNFIVTQTRQILLTLISYTTKKDRKFLQRRTLLKEKINRDFSSFNLFTLSLNAKISSSRPLIVSSFLLHSSRNSFLSVLYRDLVLAFTIIFFLPEVFLLLHGDVQKLFMTATTAC